MTCVAQGVVFGDGTVVIRWLGDASSTATFSSLSAFEAVHLHDGSRVRWEDHCCFCCGTECGPSNDPGLCTACGATWDRPADTIEPNSGRWVKAITINPREGIDGGEEGS